MKKMIMISLVCAFLVVLTSCGIKNNKPDLVADLSKQDLHLQEKLNVKSVEIVKRNTDKENKKDEIYVKAIADGFGVECDLQYKLVYNYYTDGGWVLDECIPEKTEEWEVRPTEGVSDQQIEDDMQFIADNGYGREQYFNSVKIDSKKTSCGIKRDEVHMILEQNKPCRTLKSNLTFVYDFVSKYDEMSGLLWQWERNFDKEEYTAEENYDVMCGEWYREGFSHCKYEVSKVSNNKYKLLFYPLAYSQNASPNEKSKISMEVVFSVNNEVVFVESATGIHIRHNITEVFDGERKGAHIENIEEYVTTYSGEFVFGNEAKMRFTSDESIYVYSTVGDSTISHDLKKK